MQPVRMTCFCPRAAKDFFKHWLVKNKEWKFDYFFTPEGPILFDRFDGIHRIKFRGKWTITNNFVLDMAETLAIGFGWQG